MDNKQRTVPGGKSAQTDAQVNTGAMKRRRYTMTIIAIIAILAIFAAFTFAWFTGIARNANNEITAGNLALQLLTTSPTSTTWGYVSGATGDTANPTYKFKGADGTEINWAHQSGDDGLTNALPTKPIINLPTTAGSGMPSKKLLYTNYAVSTGASAEVRTRTIVSMDDTPSALVKFLETYDQALGLSEFGIYEELPNFRQQRPIIVYNPSGRDMSYDIDFLSYEMKKDRTDPQAALDTAYYFNYTRMALDLNSASLDTVNANANDAYDLPEGILAGQWGGDSIQPLTTDVNLIAGNYKNNLANDIASITPKAFDASATEKLMTIAPHSVHIYMVDMGIPYTAGNSYQNSDLTIDVVMTTQQLGDTIHKIKTVEDLENALAAITDADTNNGNSGDTNMLMDDIDVTKDITQYADGSSTVKPGIFNLVLNGYTLTFSDTYGADGSVATQGYLKVQFPDGAVSNTTVQTMDVGSADGGEIINANRLMITGNDKPEQQCVVNWYTDICKRITATGSPAAEIKFTMDGYYINDTVNNVVNIAAQPSNLTDTTLGASQIITDGSADAKVTVVQRTTAGYITSRYTEWDNIDTDLAAQKTLAELFPNADPAVTVDGTTAEKAYIIDSKEDLKMFVELMNGGKKLTDGTALTASIQANNFFKVSSRIGEIKHFAPITGATEVTLLFDGNASITDIDVDGANAPTKGVFPNTVTLGRLVVDSGSTKKVEALTKDKVETDGSVTAQGTYQIYLSHFTCTDLADALSTKDMTVAEYAPGIAEAGTTASP